MKGVLVTKKNLSLAAFAAALVPAAVLAQPMELKYVVQPPPTASINARAAVPWVEEVMKDSSGTVDIKVFYGNIANMANSYDRLLNGVADFAYGILGPISGQFPETSVATLPFEVKSSAEASKALWILFQNGLIADEWSKVKLLSLSAFPNVALHSRKPIKTMADMKGVKTSVQSRLAGETVAALGGVPITMPILDVYPSLQRGAIDAVAIGWPATSTFKINEVVTNHTHTQLAAEVVYQAMNKDSYAKLPDAAKKAVDAKLGPHYNDMMAKAIDDNEKESRAFTESKGQKIDDLAPAEETKWKQTVAPIIETWVKATPNGDKILATFRAEIAKARR
jgi:TRAP-type C4-dicarboxylate transport system substrate-binding protein